MLAEGQRSELREIQGTANRLNNMAVEMSRELTSIVVRINDVVETSGAAEKKTDKTGFRRASIFIISTMLVLSIVVAYVMAGSVSGGGDVSSFCYGLLFIGMFCFVVGLYTPRLWEKQSK